MGGHAPLPHFLQLERPSKSEDPRQLLATEEDGSGELDLEGLDEAELDDYILSPAEAELKKKLWVKLNAEYIRTQERKRQFEEENVIPKKKPKKTRVSDVI